MPAELRPLPISCVTDARAVMDGIKDAAEVGLDIETTGLNPRADRVRLLTLATDKGCWLLDCFHADPSPLWPVLADKVVVAHNAIFDLGFLWKLGFEPGRCYCTMLASQLLYGTRQRKGFHTLHDVCVRELSLELDKEEQKSDWSGNLTREQIIYAAYDAMVLLPLRDQQHARLVGAGMKVAEEIEMRCLPAVVWMSAQGVPLDKETWTKLAEEAEAEAARLAGKLNELAPQRTGQLELFDELRWNWDSPAQVKNALAAAGLELESSDDRELARLDHPLAELMREYRGARKLATTYGVDWAAKHVNDDGTVYAAWQQIGSDAGRMSCQHPNMQQVPRGRHRACVKAPDGMVILKGDYSQIELRLAAVVSGDEAMLSEYCGTHKADLHRKTAQLMFGKESPSDDDRQVAKSANFGLVYGMGSKGYQIYAKTYGVNLTPEKARAYREAFFRAYPGLAAWHERVKREHAPETRTNAGRRRLIKDGESDTLRLNSPVQGSGADGLKLALALLWERRGECPGAVPIMAVHDEIVVLVEEGQAEAAAAWLKRCMTDGMQPWLGDVPAEVDVKCGKTWGKGK